MSDSTPDTTTVEAKTTDTKTAADTTPAAKTAMTEPKAKTATTTNTTVTDKTAEPVVAPKTAAKAKSEAKTTTKTAANTDEKADEHPELTIKVKNTGVTLLETRTGTMLESGKTTTIKVNDEVTRNQVLKNIEQLNYLHGNTLDVK